MKRLALAALFAASFIAVAVAVSGSVFGATMTRRTFYAESWNNAGPVTRDGPGFNWFDTNLGTAASDFVITEVVWSQDAYASQEVQVTVDGEPVYSFRTDGSANSGARDSRCSLDSDISVPGGSTIGMRHVGASAPSTVRLSVSGYYYE